MSVLIKGMAMPETCYECRFCESEAEYPFRLFCVAHLNRIEDPRSGRLDTCPLIELPDHGDLIDRDEFRKTMYHDTFETDSDLQKWESGCWIRYKMFERNIKSAPVVIPAERSEDEQT